MIVNHLPKLPPDTFIGAHYRLERLLESDERANFYRAIDTRTEQAVLLKLYASKNDDDWETLEYFERELNALECLEHPGIPRLIESVEAEIEGWTHYALVLEYIDIENNRIAQRLKSGWKPSEMDAQGIAVKLLETLSYLHALTPAVVHGGIRPGHIVLDPHGQTYLLEFTQAKGLNASDKEMLYLDLEDPYWEASIDAYVSSADRLDKGTDPAPDLYALGALLIELFAQEEKATSPDYHHYYETWLDLSPEFLKCLQGLRQLSRSERWSAEQALSYLNYPNKALASYNMHEKSDPVEAVPPVLPYIDNLPVDDVPVEKEETFAVRKDGNRIVNTEPLALPQDSRAQILSGKSIFIPPSGKLLAVFIESVFVWVIFLVVNVLLFIVLVFLPISVDAAVVTHFVVAPILFLVALAVCWEFFSASVLSLSLKLEKDQCYYRQKWWGLFGRRERILSLKDVAHLDFVSGTHIRFVLQNESIVSLNMRLSVAERRWLRQVLILYTKDWVSAEQWQKLVADSDEPVE